MGISYSAISVRVLAVVLFLFFGTATLANGHTKKLGINTAYFQDQEPVQPKKKESPAVKKKQIKEVPKSRKQMKPVVVKPHIKPVKIVRPKIKKH